MTITTTPLPPVETIIEPIVRALAQIEREASARTYGLALGLQRGEPDAVQASIQYVAWLRNIGDLVAAMVGRCVVETGCTATAASARAVIDGIGRMDLVLQAKHGARLDRMTIGAEVAA